ncbi:MAG: M28 family peptidase, partial [Candidatus Hodarchaeota archaeon]
KFNENYSNILILGTHYDSRARATKDSINPDLPVPGANDGASGSAVLIELARAIYNRSDELKIQVWFLFFDAEDQGYDESYGIPGWNWCEGSSSFIEDIDSFHNSSIENFDAMILLDMVGGRGLKFINEQYSTSSLLNELFKVGRQLGYTSEFPVNAISTSITDDHIAFINYGIPSADLIINFWDNPIWSYHHTSEDNLSHLSNFSLEVTGRTVEQFIYNNYLNSEDEYQGNYPWKGDLNLPDTNTLIIIIVIVAIIGISTIIFSILKKYKKSSNI